MDRLSIPFSQQCLRWSFLSTVCLLKMRQSLACFLLPPYHVVILSWPVELITACLAGFKLSKNSLAGFWLCSCDCLLPESELHFRLCTTCRNWIEEFKDKYRPPGGISRATALGVHCSLISSQVLTASGGLVKISPGSITNSKTCRTAHLLITDPSYSLPLPNPSDMIYLARSKPIFVCSKA